MTEVAKDLLPLENTQAIAAVPPEFEAALQQQLRTDERFIAHFQPDLDSRLWFGKNLLVLTNFRLLAWECEHAGKAAHLLPPKSWELAACDHLTVLELSGLSTMELLGATSRMAVWRFTLGKAPQAHLFVESLRKAKSLTLTPEIGEGPVKIASAICPSCGGPMFEHESLCASCSAQPALPPSKSLWRLVRFAKLRAGSILLGFILALASTAASLIPPYLTMPLLDKVLIPYQNGDQANFSLVPWLLGGLVMAAILAWMLTWAKTYVLASVGEQISSDLRNQTYSHLQKLSLEFFGGKRTGDLISRVSDDTQRICDFLSMQLLDFGSDLVMILLTSVVLISIDPWVAAVTLIPFPVIAWLINRVRSRLRHGFARGYAAWGEMVNVLADTIPGIRVVKAFAQEHREVERFAIRNQYVLEANNKVNQLWATFVPVITLLTDLGILIIWAFGTWQVAQGHITVGVLTVFITYIGRLYARLDSMSRMLAATQRAAASTHRIFEILDRIPSVGEPVKAIHPGRVQGGIEIRKLSFRYGTRKVLHDIQLQIRPGEMIGLVGPSGAGKSTLVNLVCRFYDPQEGAILVDGQDIRSFPVTEFRSNIGIVLQEPFLFFGTIAENIAYGRPDASRNDIVRSAKAAKAHDFILRLPDGYDSGSWRTRPIPLRGRTST